METNILAFLIWYGQCIGLSYLNLNFYLHIFIQKWDKPDDIESTWAFYEPLIPVSVIPIQIEKCNDKRGYLM